VAKSFAAVVDLIWDIRFLKPKRMSLTQFISEGISEATFYNWKSRYSGMEVSNVKRLKD
jgi:hypothetical protein